MAISNKKERIYISLEKDLMKILRDEAANNRRFPSDEIAILIEKYLKPKHENNLKYYIKIKNLWLNQRLLFCKKIINIYNKYF